LKKESDSMRKAVFLSLVAIAVLLVGAAYRSEPARAASPGDGVYDIGILQVGATSPFENDNSDFAALGSSPGFFSFSRTNINVGSLNSGGLKGIDVLIVPSFHLIGDIPAGAFSAIVAWVSGGGTLIVEPPDDSGPYPLYQAFGSQYNIFYTGGSTNNVAIADASNPLVSFPNHLTAPDLIGWGSSAHTFLTDLGSAWQVVTVDDNGIPLSACSTFGRGVIVAQGQDPEEHNTQPGTFLLIENMVVIGANSSGCSSRSSAGRNVSHESVGALFGALLQNNKNKQQAPVAPSAAAPATGALRPPSTGDAGLADSGDGLPAALLAIPLLLAATAVFATRRKRS
jgi:hypothetical protein